MKRKSSKRNKVYSALPIAALIIIVAGLICRCFFAESFHLQKTENDPPEQENPLPQGIPSDAEPGGEETNDPVTEGTDPVVIPESSSTAAEDPVTEDPVIEEPVTEDPVEENPEENQNDPKPSEPENVWSLILCNPSHSLPSGYEDQLVLESVQGKYKMDERAAVKAKEMIAAAERDGIDLMVCSAFRSNEKQTNNFKAKLQTYLDQGWDYEKAYAKTATIIAVPGTSEHQTGLAVDIVTPSYQNLDEGYAKTAAAKWLYANAADYGFILRYPSDKEDITKIIFEPWHYRYVGEEYSHRIMDSGLCLEEFLNQLN